MGVYKKLIDESDYYIVIVAGKYGSVDEAGISYTRKEYEYAVSKGIPVIGFIHSDPDSLISKKTEKEKDKIQKLKSFTELVKKKLCKFWNTPQELGAVVSRSISQAKKNYPRTGWVRADSSGNTSEKEVLQLYKKIDQLEKELERLTQTTDIEIDNLADLNDKIAISLQIKHGTWQQQITETVDINITWNDIAYYLFPKLTKPRKEGYFKGIVNGIFKEIYLMQNPEFKYTGNLSVSTMNSIFDTIKIQFELLGFISIYEDEIIKEDQISYVTVWSLTSSGRHHLQSLRAVTK